MFVKNEKHFGKFRIFPAFYLGKSVISNFKRIALFLHEEQTKKYVSHNDEWSVDSHVNEC